KPALLRVLTGVSDLKMDVDCPPGFVPEGGGEEENMNVVRKGLGMATERKPKRKKEEIKKDQKKDYMKVLDKMCGYEHGIAAAGGVELDFDKIDDGAADPRIQRLHNGGQER
ncbi:hypothetical protein THAOC_30967, partial [Thalassiosira oceanica]